MDDAGGREASPEELSSATASSSGPQSPDPRVPSTWTPHWIQTLRREELRPIIKHLQVPVRAPFLDGAARARVPDLKRALTYFSGLANEFRMNDRVIYANNGGPVIYGIVSGVMAPDVHAFTRYIL